jgi:hypothetical protein
VTPPSYEHPLAFRRVADGLARLGAPRAVAERAARTALDEAPFAEITEAGWATVCRRARQVASRPETVGYPTLGRDGLAS